MTSYDQIWTTFLNNCKVSDINLPQTDSKRYEAIRNGVMYLNNRLRTEITCNDALEVVNEELDNDTLLILINYIRYIFLLNQRTYHQNLWQPFTKDIGLKNFSSQLKSMDKSITDQEGLIEKLIMNMEVDYL